MVGPTLVVTKNPFCRMIFYLRWRGAPFEEFRTKTLEFFETIGQYKEELKTLLTENFQIIGSDTS